MCDLAPGSPSDLSWNQLQAPLDAVTAAFWHTKGVEPVQAENLCLSVGLLQKPFLRSCMLISLNTIQM